MKNKRSIYLAGAMEQASKLGAGWRKKITPFLVGLGFEVMNPVEFEPEQLKGFRPGRLPAYIVNKKGSRVKIDHWHQLKLSSNPRDQERFIKYMKQIREYDLNLIRERADCLLVLWDKAASQGAGTHDEMRTAEEAEKEVYCIELAPLPGWLVPCCTEIFSSMKEAKQYLRKQFGG